MSNFALTQIFKDALATVLTKVWPNQAPNGIAIAYSGGLDSAVLLALALEYAGESGIPLFALHIHHGLSPNADEWLAHCQQQCANAGISFACKQVSLTSIAEDGVEAAARSERYLALGQLCAEHQLPIILTAHHQDDQAETLLLQLLRGSGISGLSGMDSYNRAPALLGNPDLLIARPLLGVTKQALTDYAKAHAISNIEDESNADTRYARNALRHQVMPMLEKISPAYSARLARSAQHVQAAGRLLKELAQIDMQVCVFEDALQIDKMRDLSEDRVNNLLRFWLDGKGVRMPSTSRLSEIRHQLFSARFDAQVSIYHDQLGIHRYQNRVYTAPIPKHDSLTITPSHFKWNGQQVQYFPEFAGHLHFETAEYGVPRDWLLQQNLSLHLREGGERLKLAHNRPTRDIKSHFQSLKIPFWQRQRLPFLYANGELIHVGAVGTDAKYSLDHQPDLINFRWQAD